MGSAEGERDYLIRAHTPLRGQLEPDQPLEARRGHEIIHVEFVMLYPEVRALRHSDLHPRCVFRGRPKGFEKKVKYIDHLDFCTYERKFQNLCKIQRIK